MHIGRRLGVPTVLLGAVGLASALVFQASPVQATRGSQSDHQGRHVLLLSVDGLHASDLHQWITQHPHSALAQLSQQGTTYSNALTSEPSDSYPGLMAQITGGTPRTTGVFYDDTWTRNYWPTNGTATPSCAGAPGVETTNFEAYDVGFPTNSINRDAVDGGPSGIDQTLLPSAIINGTCQKAYPHDFLQTNTIFNVAAAADLYTAWSDKHPAYEIVRGPANTGADDLYTPEINSNTPTDPTTLGVPATITYDALKVNAILNEIDGQTSNHGVRTTSGHPAKAVPAIFGMNFQSVSVGQKFEVGANCNEPTSNPPVCTGGYVPGGYVPGTLAFTPQLAQALQFVDASIGSFVSELKAQGLWDSTELILSAKHGQSPINLNDLHKIGHQIGTVLGDAHIGVAQLTDDDVALVWLTDQSQTAAAVTALTKDQQGANTARIQTIYSGDALADTWGDPRTNNRTPDIIVQPIPGTIYTHSTAKVEEHGGFTNDDRNVALLVVNGANGDEGDQGQDNNQGDQGQSDHEANGHTVDAHVTTTQIAPTILAYLGLDPRKLDAVRKEGTEVLPGD
jgi:hypothetical protein